MIEAQATVAAVGSGEVWLDIQRQSACGSCSVKSGCGTATLAELWGGRVVQVRAVAPWPLQIGDTVLVGLAEGALWRGALLVYLLPIALLLAGALLGESTRAGAGEQPVVLLSGLGLGLGFLTARVLSRRLRNHPRYQPVVLRRLPVGVVPGNMRSPG